MHSSYDLKTLIDPVTRFAPSPTGYLHLGHVAHAVFVFGLSWALGARVLLRMEDHDRGRSRAEYETAILEDLEWLGLIPDMPALTAFQGTTPFRQSDNDAAYQRAAARLAEGGGVYGCGCSRKRIALVVGYTEPRHEISYPGMCRERGLPLDSDHGWRFRVSEKTYAFFNGNGRAVRQHPASQCGDVLIRDRHGNWTYQFAVAVDDFEQGVNLVIRGEDLLESTGRQLAIAEALGRKDPPVFVHHRLIRDTDGSKLSKRERATPIRELRRTGKSPAQVLGIAAHGVGLVDRVFDVNPNDLADLFTGLEYPEGFVT